jgi:DNA-binding NarL/FixJ family response regulator
MTTNVQIGSRSRHARTLRILLVDDHELVRRGVRYLLESEPGWEVCGEAATGREAVEMAQRLSPDVVVLDLSMPSMNGIEAARRIRQVAPHCEVLILTVHESEDMVRDALAAGARGYILKSDAGSDLVNAVRALSRRKTFFTADVQAMVLQGYLKGLDEAEAVQAASRRLTAREREIVQLVSEGKSNKEVATTLGISVKTAETHRTNVLRKLELHSVTDLVRYAVRNGIIEP